MFTLYGEVMGDVEFHIDGKYREPQFAVLRIYANSAPLDNEDRRAFVEENRKELESMCQLLNTQWLETTAPYRLSGTVH